jgi:ABC-type cobalt transport system substrate-binding protein
MMISGTSPFTNRENLIIFNVVLIGVMALISFSFIGSANHGLSDSHRTQLIVLSVLALVVNAVALSAISFRIAEWGMTPNRLAVLGSNILIMAHLTIVTTFLLKSLKSSGGDEKISNSIVKFLPVYMIWTAVVTFLFPMFSALSSSF